MNESPSPATPPGSKEPTPVDPRASTGTPPATGTSPKAPAPKRAPPPPAPRPAAPRNDLTASERDRIHRHGTPR